MNDEFDEREFTRCIMILAALVMGFVIVLQFVVLVRIGEVKRSQKEQRELTHVLIDYTIATNKEDNK